MRSFYPVGHTVKKMCNLKHRSLLTIKISNREEIKFQIPTLLLWLMARKVSSTKMEGLPIIFWWILDYSSGMCISRLHSFKDHEIFTLLATELGTTSVQHICDYIWTGKTKMKTNPLQSIFLSVLKDCLNTTPSLPLTFFVLVCFPKKKGYVQDYILSPVFKSILLYSTVAAWFRLCN